MALHELLNCVQFGLDLCQIGAGLVCPFFRFNDLLDTRGKRPRLIPRVLPPVEHQDRSGAGDGQCAKSDDQGVGFQPAEHHQPAVLASCCSWLKWCSGGRKSSARLIHPPFVPRRVVAYLRDEGRRSARR